MVAGGNHAKTGGYGVVNTLGGGFTAASTVSSLAPPNGAISRRQAGNPEYIASMDPRIKTAIAIAPWGYTMGFWDKEGLAGIKAPIPAPKEPWPAPGSTVYNAGHYMDPVWDTVRMNNIAQHFAAAWLGKYLKADPAMDAYLNLVPVGKEAVWSVDAKGQPKPDHTYWKGFGNRSAVGLRFEHLKP